MINVTASGAYTPANLDIALQVIRQEVGRTSQAWAQRVQDTMRANAPSNYGNGPSVTGKNARQSLETEVGTGENGDIVIVARSTRASPRAWRSFQYAPIGMFLERGTRYMAKRAVIWPTLNILVADLGRDLEVTMQP